MKKLSEVCKIVGVTRRTLQEYDNIGLLHPSEKTEAGYWMYDDAAVKRLILIQFFVETGYKRKDVKRLIEDPTLDIMSELDNMISSLEEKRRRFDGMINMLKTIKLTESLNENTRMAFMNMDLTSVYKEKSFSDVWNLSVEETSAFSMDDMKQAKQFIPFWTQLVAVGLLRGNPINAPEVIECVKSFCDSLMIIVLSDDESDEITKDDIITPTEVATAIENSLADLISSPKILKLLETQCGENAAPYIMEAIKTYCNSLTEEDVDRWRQRVKEKLRK